MPQTFGFVLVPLFMLVVYGFLGFVIWKFYCLFANINENLEGIRRAIQSAAAERPPRP
jgi:hypothetical protein